ncbi:MAG: hypothetical protein GY861_24870 [bacterium]|nr:hypothetical protein [bacterium]
MRLLIALVAVVLLVGCTSGPRFTEEKLPYDHVRSLTSVDGKLAYIAGEDCSNTLSQCKANLVVFDGVEQKRYEQINIGSLMDVGGKLAYIAGEDCGKYFQCNKTFVIYAGVEQSISNRYLVDVGGKLAYKESGDGAAFIILDGVDQEKYDFVGDGVDIGGKLAHIAKDENEKAFVVFDGVDQEKYDIVGTPVDVGGKPAYLAGEGCGSKFIDECENVFIVFEGAEKKKYDVVRDLTAVGDKLAYLAKDGCESNDLHASCESTFVVVDGVEQKQYEVIDFSGRVDVGGKLAYEAGEKCDSKYISSCKTVFVVYDGVELHKGKYTWAADLSEIGGRLAYRTGKGNGIDVLVYDSVEKKTYDGNIEFMAEIGGRFVYVVAEETINDGDPRPMSKQYVVIDGKKTKEYNVVWEPVEINGKLAYIAENYLVKEKKDETFLVVED